MFFNLFHIRLSLTFCMFILSSSLFFFLEPLEGQKSSLLLKICFVFPANSAAVPLLSSGDGLLVFCYLPSIFRFHMLSQSCPLYSFSFPQEMMKSRITQSMQLSCLSWLLSVTILQSFVTVTSFSSISQLFQGIFLNLSLNVFS